MQCSTVLTTKEQLAAKREGDLVFATPLRIDCTFEFEVKEEVGLRSRTQEEVRWCEFGKRSEALIFLPQTPSSSNQRPIQ